MTWGVVLSAAATSHSVLPASSIIVAQVCLRMCGVASGPSPAMMRACFQPRRLGAFLQWPASHSVNIPRLQIAA
jgi:hypothetical protein